MDPPFFQDDTLSYDAMSLQHLPPVLQDICIVFFIIIRYIKKVIRGILPFELMRVAH